MVIQKRHQDRHNVECLMRTSPCCLCAQEIRFRDMEGHLSHHDVDTSIIDWSRPLNPQEFQYLKISDSSSAHNTPQLSRTSPEANVYHCICGAGTASMEELQIHVLTECSQQDTAMEAYGFNSSNDETQRARDSPWACSVCTFENEVCLRYALR